ncbi:MAG: hypothetical protein A2096_12480 [Spirochaetes bacterium GWF1_41_5]|nr:MAG: hypothetical protein A2096_12480 [Spirochaetes bacterium GWF1_41_5]
MIYTPRFVQSFYELMQVFKELTGFNIAVNFKDEEIISRQQNKNKIFLNFKGHRNDFCNNIKIFNNRTNGCNKYDLKKRGEKAELLKKPFIDECPFGVLELVIPFICRNEYIATIFCGQFCKYPSRSRGLDEVICNPKNRHLDKTAVEKAYKHFTYIPSEKLIKIGNFLHMALYAAGEELFYSGIEEKKRMNANSLIKAAIHYIENSEQPVYSLHEIAHKLEISGEHLSRLFKKQMKQNFIDYVNEVKISKAQSMLKFTSLSIVEIALEIGFSKASYFGKIYKKITGVTPSYSRKVCNYKNNLKSG